jgi:hypothetical protein
VLGAVLVAFTFGSIATAASDGWLESFQQGSLDHEHWERTSQGDFREWSAEVVPSERGLGYRLRLRADTRGTRDDTLKYLGVRSARAIELRPGVRISVRLDWGDQPNASYMTAGVVLSPHVTGGNPLDTDDWLKLVYVGVPPAGNARLLVAVKRRGGERTVYTDGWPERNKQGRRIAVQDLTLRVGDRTLEVWEGARRAWRSLPGDIDLETVHLYLQMSSHSNYPARSVYFERISVE